MTDQLTHDSVVGDGQNEPKPAETAAAPRAEAAEAAPAPKRKRRFLWLWIAGGAFVVVLAAALTLLIAPGTTVAGVPVGGLPPSIAANVVSQRLADATITVDGTRVTGRQLGVQVKAGELTNRALADRPLWNVGAWFGAPIEAPVTFEAGKADKTLQQALPAHYTTSTDATLELVSKAYIAKPAVPGTKVDTTALARSLQKAFGRDLDHVSVRTTQAATQPPISTDTAAATAKKLNGMLGTIGFYVGTERTVPVAPDVAASWLTVTPDDSTGSFSIAADQDKIQAAVDGLPGKVNRQAVNAQNIVNSAGAVLRVDTAGKTGRTLGDTSGVAQAFATQLSDGNAEYRLPVTETPFQTTSLKRSIDVDLSTQRLSMIQNGAVVGSWPISSGLSATPTPTGHFTVNVHVREQTMSSTQYGYSVPNVQWVMYFDGNGDGFHGVYWHNNFGHPMSHGCVGMPNSEAEQLYDWSPDGIEVYIH
ncbi:L,D-transpeptidase family protein [Humibacter ginsenosidimutans]|uniref:L,D-transpeptidase family protein n=1 Tax=Humibacter ginsenosidimutans TaxID=2599293 RepID=A0A5B8M8I2_9MICO|nr:L,D-transpeptidase family protein [Humibacter ginsenosidimutans]QDZ15740.1 L,D-transpeptidase family protein [Humibacter ginsenosidimutans]